MEWQKSLNDAQRLGSTPVLQQRPLPARRSILPRPAIGRVGPRSLGQGQPVRSLIDGVSNAEHLMVAINHEKSLLGQPLSDILNWQRPTSSAGYCEPASRKHKWGLVLETIHYALSRKEFI